MKFTTIAAAGSLLVGTALAAKATDNVEDVISKLPKCVKDCLPDAISGSCSSKTDYDCACDHYGAVTLSLSTCISGGVITGDCTMDDIENLASFSSDVCTGFTDSDVDGINSALSDLIGTATSGLPNVSDLIGTVTSGLSNLPSLISSATSDLGGITAAPTQTSDSGSNSDGSSTDSPGAGPMVTPMAWAGAAAFVAVLAL